MGCISKKTVLYRLILVLIFIDNYKFIATYLVSGNIGKMVSVHFKIDLFTVYLLVFMG